MTLDANNKPLKLGQAVQITNPKHQWFPEFLVVTELKGWGVMGYAVVIDNTEKPNGLAYIRAKSEDIEWIGDAVIVDDDYQRSGEAATPCLETATSPFSED